MSDIEEATAALREWETASGYAHAAVISKSAQAFIAGWMAGRAAPIPGGQDGQ